MCRMVDYNAPSSPRFRTLTHCSISVCSRGCGGVRCSKCAPHRQVCVRRGQPMVTVEKGATVVTGAVDRLRVCEDCVSGQIAGVSDRMLSTKSYSKTSDDASPGFSKDSAPNEAQFRASPGCCSDQGHALEGRKTVRGRCGCRCCNASTHTYIQMQDLVGNIISLVVPSQTAEIAMETRTRSMDSNSTAACSSVRENSSMADKTTAAADTTPNLTTPNPSPPVSRPGSASSSNGPCEGVQGGGGRVAQGEGLDKGGAVSPSSPLPGTTGTRRTCINCGAKYKQSAYMEACSLDCNAMAVLAANARAEMEAVTRATTKGGQGQGAAATTTTSGRRAALVPIPLPKGGAVEKAVPAPPAPQLRPLPVAAAPGKE